MAAGSPIAHKYREGKIKSTLKRESKELEVVEREAIEGWPRALTRSLPQRFRHRNSLGSARPPQHEGVPTPGGKCESHPADIS